MSKLNNIEKLQKLKKMSSLKAELHKENLLSYFDWKISDNQDDMIGKAISYGETGFSLYQLFRKYTSKTNKD